MGGRYEFSRLAPLSRPWATLHRALGVADASLESQSWFPFDSISIGEVRFLDGFGNLLCRYIRDGFIPT
jgi:hypothetical protein